MVQKEAVLGGCQVVVVTFGSSVVHKEAIINDTGGKFAFGIAIGSSGLGPLGRPICPLEDTRPRGNKRGNTREYVKSRDSVLCATANGNKVGKKLKLFEEKYIMIV
jgi:hypothetical protein